MNKMFAKWKASRFVRNEDGSILIFVLFVFTTMAFVGGTAIDLARHETMRASMQYNLDRAVLAAASLKQTKVPDAVVDDYMSKVTNLQPVSVETTYDVGMNFRTVSSTATAELDTMFMNMAGIDSLPITVTSSAEERIPKLEISLVLDVSGSMNSNHKLANLKAAAKDFVSTMLNGVDDDHVAISIIPFNNSVSPSQGIFDQLNVNEKHDYSRCLDFADEDFNDVAIDPAQMQEQLIYTSLWGDWQNLNSSGRTCYTDDYFQIMPYSDNITELHNKIDSLVADGWTAGHLGLKWGTALLDPAFKPVATGLIAAGDVDPGFVNVPAAYDDFDTLKVLIMMGDGANTYEFRMGDDYNGANSDLWEVVYAEQIFSYAYHKHNANKISYSESKCGKKKWVCVYTAGPQKSAYYLDDPNSSYFFDIENYNWISGSKFNNLNNTLNGWISSTRLSWGKAWGLMPAQWYDNIVGGNAFSDLVYGSGRTSSEADAAMAASCEAARDQGIVVYTIGFETSSSTSAKLRDCASTPAHYYDAVGIQITEVFAQIAASIQKLKLTQ